MLPLVSIVITTHGRAGDLPVLLGTLANQRVNIEVPHSRDPNITCQWGMGPRTAIVYETIVVSDGPYGGTLAEREMFNVLIECPKEGGVGHHTREPGIMAATGEWVVLTNSDNLFMAGWLDLISGHLLHQENGLVYWDVVNNLWRWSTLGGSELSRGRIDLSAVAVQTYFAKQVGFKGREYDSDWDYIDQCAQRVRAAGLKAVKLPNTLSVHN